LSNFASFIVSPFISLAVAIKLGRGVGMSRPQAAPTFRRSRSHAPTPYGCNVDFFDRHMNDVAVCGI
jgi:hypothetical protein